MYYPFYIFDRQKDFFDLLIFTTDANHHDMANHCFNHLPELDNFKYYFRDKAHKLMLASERHTFTLPLDMRSNVRGLGQVDSDENRRQYRPKRYRFYVDGQPKMVTAREYDVLKYLINGHSSKFIGEILQISNRTVEKYLENVRNRLACDNKQELLEILQMSGLFNSITEQ